MENPDDRFLRNHQENNGIMRAIAARQARAGEEDDAERIRAMIATWERIAELIRQRKTDQT
jgi:hypothetical protein